jgi:hypothetical protein
VKDGDIREQRAVGKRQQPAPLRRPEIGIQGQTGNPVYLISLRDVPIVLAPRRLLRVPQEMRTGDMVADADPGAAQAGDEFRSHVSARAIEAVCLLMVVSLDFETLMQIIP